MPPRTPQPSPADAQRLADIHFVDRYDRAQLAALDRLDQLDHAATPLVVPRGVNRVYRTEPTNAPTRLSVTAPEFRVSRDTLLTLLDLGLAHTHHLVHLVRIDPGHDRDSADAQRTAYVLTATRHGLDVLDVARRLGRLPHQHDPKASP